MSRPARLHRVLGLLVVLLLCPAPAWAHKLNVFAHVEGRTIRGTAYFGSGTAAQGVSVVAFDPAGNELGRTTTDSQGLFSLEAHKRCDHRLVVETADGHGAEYTISAAELPADLPAGAGSAMPKAKTTAGPIATTAGRRFRQRNRKEARRPARVRSCDSASRLDKYEQRIRFRDLLGGIGFILGISGIAFYFLGAKRNRHG